jgi:hypothetical protein
VTTADTKQYVDPACDREQRRREDIRAGFAALGLDEQAIAELRKIDWWEKINQDVPDEPGQLGYHSVVNNVAERHQGDLRRKFGLSSTASAPAVRKAFPSTPWRAKRITYLLNLKESNGYGRALQRIDPAYHPVLALEDLNEATDDELYHTPRALEQALRDAKRPG